MTWVRTQFWRMEGLLQDARHAVRIIRTRPGFSVAALLSLALGIGANTAIFSVLDAVLIRPLPYPGSDALVGVDAKLSPAMYMAGKENARTFESFGVWINGAATVTGM